MQISVASKYRTSIDPDKITAFCQQWQINKFALFGSVLRDDFDLDNSDIDVLVSFAPNVPWTILDLVDMEDQLEEIFNRKVDLVERISIEKSQNPFRKKAILESYQVIYANPRKVLRWALV
ncbi:nucleotidyltransferase family protein [Synechocystis salina]|uniref:Nucleotidyltransferase family protein n=1 Tax=Synechocystis salina LEGE 00031 TaxID=1828736 RepID=A0ABR9VRJ0_9SYNC|nr:nucleotidyltransferase family protein [Synechocystis salina]MBE9240650.1 nucleotidyltransferase family protein [Synechocystis salina LEGE 00041]MBE9253950.1 nucleotidyltransferase family protein [Synechocystis salina LEGE 00031]